MRFEFSEQNKSSIMESSPKFINISPAKISNSTIEINGNGEMDDFFATDDTNGSVNNPYIFENSTINSNGSEFSIKIMNTDRFLIIKNNTLYNASKTAESAGIYLQNCSNINIIENIIYNNNHGIYLKDSKFNNLSKNAVFNNDLGILLDNSNNTNLIGNDVYGNEFSGISIKFSENNNITNNSASDNLNGFLMENAMNFTLMGNKAYVNKYSGYNLISSENFLLTMNDASSNSNGFLFEDSNRLNVSNNVADENSGNGYRFVSTSNSSLINNSASNNENGYLIEDSEDNEIINCSGNNNDYGIYLNNSEYNDLISNDFQDNDVGVYVQNSANNLFDANLVQNNNLDGIYLYNSNYTIFSNNKVLDNNKYGIYLDGSHNNSIWDNLISNNREYGIFLSSNSLDNEVKFNLLRANRMGCIEFPESGNNVHDNECIEQIIPPNNDLIWQIPLLVGIILIFPLSSMIRRFIKNRSIIRVKSRKKKEGPRNVFKKKPKISFRRAKIPSFIESKTPLSDPTISTEEIFVCPNCNEPLINQFCWKCGLYFYFK